MPPQIRPFFAVGKKGEKKNYYNEVLRKEIHIIAVQGCRNVNDIRSYWLCFDGEQYIITVDDATREYIIILYNILYGIDYQFVGYSLWWFFQLRRRTLRGGNTTQIERTTKRTISRNCTV